MKPTTITLEASLDQPTANGRYLYSTLNLPASHYEILDFTQKMRAAGRMDHDFEFSVIDCPALPGFTDTRLDAPTIGELNAFALRLAILDAPTVWNQLLLRPIFTMTKNSVSLLSTVI